MKFLRLLALAAVLALGFASHLPAADLSVTAASVVPGARARILTGTAGATITAGQIVYLDATTSTYKLADANASAATSTAIGMALNAASSGQPISVDVDDDDLTVGATLSMTAPVYVVSATAGGIAPIADLTTGWYPCVVIVAKSTTKAVLKIVRGPVAVAALFESFDAHRLVFVLHRLHGARHARREEDLALAA